MKERGYKIFLRDQNDQIEMKEENLRTEERLVTACLLSCFFGKYFAAIFTGPFNGLVMTEHIYD